VPIIATNDVRFAESSDRPLFDVLTCVHHKTTLDAGGRKLARNAERYLKSPEAMAQLFADRPAALAGTMGLAERIEKTKGGLAYPVSLLSGARWRDRDVVSAPYHRGWRARTVPPLSRQGACADRARAGAHREARSRRVLPHRLGHRQLLPAAGHPRQIG